MASKVVNEPVLVALLGAKDVPQGCSLLKVHRSDLAREAAHFANPLLVFRDGGVNLAGGLESCGLERRVDVVRVGPVVVCEVHEAIALVGRVNGRLAAVCRQLLVVNTETVSGSIGVGKHASLQDCNFEGGDLISS